MALLTVIHIFILSILSNMMLPSVDVYSDVYLMYQTWTFQNTDSVEMSGCRACFGKSVKDLIPKEDECEKCVTKNVGFGCGRYYSFLNFYSSIDSKSINKCENKKWRVYDKGSLEGQCDITDSWCCFETQRKDFKINNETEKGTKTIKIHTDLLIDCDFYDRPWYFADVSNNYGTPCLLVGKAKGYDCSGILYYSNKSKINNFLEENENLLSSEKVTQIGFKFLGVNFSSYSSSDVELVQIDNLEKDETFECGLFFKPKNVNIIGDRLDNDCGLDSCKVHLDYLHYYADGMHDLHSWSSKSGVFGGQRIGGKGCRLLRVYAWSMAIPIIINFIFCGIVFLSDIKSGKSNKYESPFLLTFLYPQWRTFKLWIGYFKNKDEEELGNKLDENDKEVSFIEPFCESGLQVLTILCIIFATEGFYPKDFQGNSKNEMPLSVCTLFLSLFSASFGITKFFVKGPLPILPQDAPLGGLLSVKFFLLMFLNTMFVVRAFCLEGAFFSSYRYDRTDYGIKNIDPLIPEEYRLIIYLLPGVCSFLINLIRLAISIKPKDFRYFKVYPQFILSPMFCPLMFENNPDQSGENQPPLRLWKLGSILNSVFMGCIPQALLIILDVYKGVPSWDFNAVNRSGVSIQDNNALLRYPYGNIIFSIATFFFYLFLMTIFFGWEKIFKEDGLLCTFCKSMPKPCPNPCCNPQSKDSDPSTSNEEENRDQAFELVFREPSSGGSIQDFDVVKNLERAMMTQSCRQHELTMSQRSVNDKTEKEEHNILRLDDDDSGAKSRKQNENSSNQGLKDMRSSDLFGMLVSRRIRK